MTLKHQHHLPVSSDLRTAMKEDQQSLLQLHEAGNLQKQMANTRSNGNEQKIKTPAKAQAQAHPEKRTQANTQAPTQAPTQARIQKQTRQPKGQFKLISVSFKEAALDSPSFRASVNHMDNQLNNIEQWLIALSSSIKKLPRYLQEVESFCNSFLEHLAPGFLQDGFIDQEYTVEALHATILGLKTIWGRSLNAFSINPQILDEMSEFRKSRVVKYRELRRRFELCQIKYDKYLSIFVSSSKSKDAVMVVEDAKQLHQVRKEYIHISLDLVVELQDIGSSLDRLLVTLNYKLWEKKWSQFANSASSDVLREHWEKVQQVQSWCESYTVAIGKLRHDMTHARLQVEEGANVQFQPSLAPLDYLSSSINYGSLAEIDETGFEKHGYLFMKTWVERSSKPVWVRRWCFLKNGVFGILVLSPSQTSVEESDKIGILLCNVQYSPNEDRRFCFEIKTSELTITLQAETLIELKSWLKVFQNERDRVTAAAPDSSLFQIASNRFPPILNEFASGVNTAMDRELSNIRIINSAGQAITSSSLTRYVEKFGTIYERHLYYQIPKVNPPIMTDSTKSATIAYSCVAATVLPTALTANIWGSVNWGLYYLYDSEKQFAAEKLETVIDYEMVKYQEDHLGLSTIYPSFFPQNLIPLDIQMRALFENVLQPGEYCVMSFGCIWAPNSRQELAGRCFLTTNHAYLYNQALGFVALYKGLISRLVSVDFVAQRNFDLLKVYDVDGVIKLKLFLEDVKLIKKKMTYLIDNMASDQPKNLRAVLAAFVEIERETKREEEDQKILRKINDLSKQLSSKNLSHDRFAFTGDTSSIVPSLNSGALARKIDYTDHYSLLREDIYPIPPKAVFHAMLGDDSAVFKDETALTKLGYFFKKPWRSSELNGHLYRQATIPVSYGGISSRLHFEQEIEVMDDNSYYTFTHSISEVEFFIGSPFKLTQRFVIVSISGKRTKLLCFFRVDFKRYSIWNPLVRIVVNQISIDQFRKVNKMMKYVVKSVGHHGMIVKAIYLYGKLSHTKETETVEPIPLIRFGMLFSVQLLSAKITKTLKHYARLWLLAVLTAIRYFVKFISTNFVLIGIIVCLSILNLMLAGKSTINYWTAHKASKLIHDYVSQDPLMLQRAVYSRDIQDYIQSSMQSKNLSNGVTPFSLFQKSSFTNGITNSTSIARNSYFSPETKTVARNLRNAYQDIGIKRHELLVQLKLLDKMEKEISMAEYTNWLYAEVQQCDYIQESILSQFSGNNARGDWTESSTGQSNRGVENILEYCQDCRAVLKGLI